MLWYNKKGEAPAFNVAIYAVLGLVFLGLIIGIYTALKDDLLTAETFQQGGCMFTNTIKCNGGIFSGMPSLCLPEIIEEPLDTAKLADLTRDTWWMYKQGTCDFGNSIDEVYSVYTFIPKTDINLEDFVQHLLTNNRKTKNVAVENSDYAYLEANTEGRTICFDRNDTNIKEEILRAGEDYYIHYYDNQDFTGPKQDRILISSNPNFDKESLDKTIGLAVVGVLSGEGVLGAAHGILIANEYDTDGGCLIYYDPFGSPNE